MTARATPAPGAAAGAGLALPTAQAARQAQARNYREILASTLLMGGASMFSMLVGLVRTKILAVLLGPAGYGLMGVYALIADLARCVAQLGINDSGVRQIAAAVATGDAGCIGRTMVILRRVAVACGLLGAVLLVVLAPQVSVLTFGDAHHAVPVAWLALAVFFSLVAGGQVALIQGLRRIGDVARIGALGAVLSLVTSVPLVLVLREDGLVPSIICGAALSVATAWWYARKVRVDVPRVALAELARVSASLLTLGLAVMVSALLTTGAAYAVRSMVLRSAGLDAAGHYHAAWMLGGLYVGFILQALAVDYFPRLVGVVADDAACNRLVNEQTQMCLLLAAPGVLATLTLAPLAVEWFYSDRFRPATEVLRWICLGTALRIVIWPISFIIVARNRQRLFVAIELAWTLLYLALTWLCLQRYGIEGAGMACLGAYLFHAALVYPAVWRLSRFGWTGVNLRTAAWFILAAAAVFCSPHLLAPWWAGAFGAAMTLLATVVCARRIVRLTDPLRCPRALAWLLAGGRP